jgi:hypothetical protein
MSSQAAAAQAPLTLKTAGLVFADKVIQLQKDGKLSRAEDEARALANATGAARAAGVGRYDTAVKRISKMFNHLRTWDHDCTLAYWTASMSSAWGCRHLSISQDAVDVGGKKVEISAVWLPEVLKAFWAAPQVVRQR